MQSFSDDFMFLVCKAREDHIPNKEELELLEVCTPDDVVQYLEAQPFNSVVLAGSNDRVFGLQLFTPPIWVARTADETTYYGAQYPVEEPDDVLVEGVDIEEALRESTIEYYE